MERGIIYVGHLPKGFNERELKSFFNQFGDVTKLRVSRSKSVHLHVAFTKNTVSVKLVNLFE